MRKDTTMEIKEIMRNFAKNKNKLKQRFVKDYNLPINVFNDEMFMYYQDLYDFFPKDTWNKLCRLVDDKFKGNTEAWLDYCAKFRDDVINNICQSQEYFDFINQDMSKYKKPLFGEKSYYTEATDGKYFVSIDLKKANFQALKYAGVIKDESYDALVDRFGGDEYLKNSKYLRQVIFGKMNPGRTIAVEKHIMGLIHDMVEEKMTKDLYKYMELYSLNSDELVYSFDYDNAFSKYCHDMAEVFTLSENEHKTLKETFHFFISTVFNNLEFELRYKQNLHVRCELVKITKLPIVNCNDNNIDAYERLNVITGKVTLKKASTTFYPQIYKLWKGLEIEDRDLVFYADDQLAKFFKPLHLKK